MYGFYDNPTDYTINDLDSLALAESTDERRAFIVAAFSDPAYDAELEEKAHNRAAPTSWSLNWRRQSGPEPERRQSSLAVRTPALSTRLPAAAGSPRYSRSSRTTPRPPMDTQKLLIQNEYAIVCQGAAQYLPMTEETYDLAAPCAQVTLVCRPDVTGRKAAAAGSVRGSADLVRLTPVGFTAGVRRQKESFGGQ